ncbi:MAG: hypothetical protein ACI9DC_004986 [Gammaproteobacteria bacterium]|jgi:hypothetical protein
MRLLLNMGALLTIALLAIVVNWALEHYRASPIPDRPPEDPRFAVRHTAYLAYRAAAHFQALNADEQRDLRAQVVASMSTLDEWAQQYASAADLLCLGERHEDAVRAFIASQVLPRLSFQVLMLETSRLQLHELIARFNQHKPAIMLGASLAPILRAALSRQPPVRVLAIDEPQGLRRRESNAVVASVPTNLQVDRESAVVERIRAQWKVGQQHIILFGALHCRFAAGWMMGKLTEDDHRIRDAGISSAVVLARQHEGSAQMLMYLLEEMDLARDIVVIPQISRFPRLIQQWLPPVTEAIADYDSAIVFDERLRTAPTASVAIAISALASRSPQTQ